jgi:hypothetical protein
LSGAISFGEDLNFLPFNVGGGAWPPEAPASTTKLGGTGTLNTPSNKSSMGNIQPTEFSVTTWDCSEPAWKQQDEHFNLAAYVSGIFNPLIGAAVSTFKWAGGFELRTMLDARICRQDTVNIQLSGAPFVTVPNIQIGTTWNFSNLPVNVNYRAQACSSFWYSMAYDVFFKMRFISEKHLIHVPSAIDIVIGAGAVCTEWNNKVGSFAISGSLPVVPKDKIAGELMISSTQFAPHKMNVIIPPSKPVLKVATLQETQKTIREKGRVLVPKPTVEAGVPVKGQYTTTLGTATQAMAGQIINALKAKGIPAFITSVPGLQDSLVTLGSFANRNDAELLMVFMKGAFGVDSIVSQTIDSKSYIPMQSDVLMKLSR